VGHNRGQLDERLDAAKTLRDLKDAQGRKNGSALPRAPVTSNETIPLKPFISAMWPCLTPGYSLD